ncbi:Sua5/YciO/YrdC/YwlC family protein [Candidatus Cloacimonadota bacterium]
METYSFLSDRKLADFLKGTNDFTFLHFTGSMLGIGAPVTSRIAIGKIDHLKNRADSKGYIILIPDTSWLTDFKLEINKVQRRLIQQYWPGELTIIFIDVNNMFDSISIDGKIAIRIPSDPFLRKFIMSLGEPVISTSINRSGQTPLSDLNVIRQEYGDWFDFQLLPQDLKLESGPGSSIIDFTNDQLNVLREGSIPKKELLDSANDPLILFICTGNICRSPIAEYLAREFLKIENIPARSRSAGFLESGNMISSNSRILLNEAGIDAEQHRSTEIDDKLLRESWLILTMELRHKNALLKRDPNLTDKVFTLSEFCGDEYCLDSLDIDDPYGSGLDRYRVTYKLIEARVKCLVELVKQEV